MKNLELLQLYFLLSFSTLFLIFHTFSFLDGPWPVDKSCRSESLVSIGIAVLTIRALHKMPSVKSRVLIECLCNVIIFSSVDKWMKFEIIKRKEKCGWRKCNMEINWRTYMYRWNEEMNSDLSIQMENM